MEAMDGSSSSGGIRSIAPSTTPEILGPEVGSTNKDTDQEISKDEKAAQEWEQKYYKEKAQSLKVLQADTMRIVNVSSSMKLAPTSKMESVINGRNKGKEMVQE